MKQRTYISIIVLALAFTAILWGVALKVIGSQQAIFGEKEAQTIYSEQSMEVSYIEKEEPIEILFVGDIMLSRGVAYQTEQHGGDGKYPFEGTAEVLRSADITFGNLEGPLSDKGVDQRHLYSFRADTKMLDGLTYAGFDVLSLANNHIGDWGVEALSDTALRLKAAGIDPVGVGQTIQDAHEPAVRYVDGKRIAFLAYTNLLPGRFVATDATPGATYFSLEGIIEDISKAKEHADIVVVSLHWGEEYETEPRAYQIEWGHMLIDMGADIIVGHHPHVVQPVERYNSGIIIYSLGNFVFDQNFSKETMRGMAVSVSIDDEDALSYEAHEVLISSQFQPIFADQ
jgi:poly-gamma-glutamate synthesis protein (capsule biosynthesis protein)